ncbi:metallophosphoesterase [Chromohalobacter sp. HP20-39]|uniref:metallophosphoesterase n=1 Tax=Chromohalobacter sp. HP20-39 TaxID=3079306 RepID=UPI00294B27D3|nr:metallophosphoesterase [Chromohalobacter sp. HP20-39]MDV6319198.1 metallophosphoesterase [Chromohalobacter sp. HP20-39]
MIQRHGPNERGRDFIVGDIHGQLALLHDRLNAVGFDRRRDRLFSVGDLIDRGADSLGCLSLALEPWFYAVRGNHEMLAYDALLGEERGSLKARDAWMINGGTWALEAGLGEAQTMLQQALPCMPYAREVLVAGKRLGIVHAEPPSDWNDVATPSQDLLWGRMRIRRGDGTPVSGIDAVVVGHTIVERPMWLGNVHYIDTGAFTTGRLTLIEARTLLSGIESSRL